MLDRALSSHYMPGSAASSSPLCGSCKCHSICLHGHRVSTFTGRGRHNFGAGNVSFLALPRGSAFLGYQTGVSYEVVDHERIEIMCKRCYDRIQVFLDKQSIIAVVKSSTLSKIKPLSGDRPLKRTMDLLPLFPGVIKQSLSTGDIVDTANSIEPIACEPEYEEYDDDMDIMFRSTAIEPIVGSYVDLAVIV